MSGDLECQMIWNDVNYLSRSDAGAHASATAAAAASKRKERCMRDKWS